MGLDMVDLLWKIEKHFNIVISNEDAAKMFTVADIMETVIRYLPEHSDSVETAEMVRKIIADQAGYELHEVQPYMSITNDLGMD